MANVVNDFHNMCKKSLVFLSLNSQLDESTKFSTFNIIKMNLLNRNFLFPFC